MGWLLPSLRSLPWLTSQGNKGHLGLKKSHTPPNPNRGPVHNHIQGTKGEEICSLYPPLLKQAQTSSDLTWFSYPVDEQTEAQGSVLPWAIQLLWSTPNFWDPGVKVLSTLWPGRLPLISPACAGVESREGPPLALQLSSNRREREVGQVPAGVGRTLASAPGEPWSPSQLQPEREAAQRQNPRWDLRKEEEDITSTSPCLKDRTHAVPSARHTGVVQWAVPTRPCPNDTKPWTQGQGPQSPS